MAHDLVLRGGTVVDGTGAARRVADVAIDDGVISAVGDRPGEVGPGRREIDADGQLVTPGWVDIHTHYDAQATWDPYLTPSGWHGVTTAVMGNCGVGFAPVAPDRREYLVEVMEGVEDIPGAALTDGIEWGWESFEEYLDDLGRRPFVADLGAQVPHVAVRTHVMGERGVGHEAASADDLAEMQRLVTSALRAGALGVSTSRTPLHKTIRGEVVPGTHAEVDELLMLGHAIADAGHGVFQSALHHPDVPGAFGWLRAIAEITGGPVTFNLNQIDAAPDVWRDVLPLLEQAAADGLGVKAQIAGRAIGILMSWDGTVHPFIHTPTWRRLAALDRPARRAALADPAIRAALVTEDAVAGTTSFGRFVTGTWSKMFPFTGETDYEPGPERSVAALAAAEGVSPAEYAMARLDEADGQGLLYFPLMNYTGGNLDLTHTLQQHPGTLMGLSDGGAHCGAICDGGMPTFMIQYWTRDRPGDRLGLEAMVHRQTAQVASHVGLHDRGVVAPGYRADLNVFDHAALDVEAPRIAWDLPTGARRYVQRARGYTATVCAGAVVAEHDEFTGELPGRLIRGPQAAPAS